MGWFSIKVKISLVSVLLGVLAFVWLFSGVSSVGRDPNFNCFLVGSEIKGKEELQLVTEFCLCHDTLSICSLGKFGKLMKFQQSHSSAIEN